MSGTFDTKQVSPGLPTSLRLPVLFLSAEIGGALCFDVAFFLARFTGGSHSAITAHALGAEAIAAAILAIPYAVVGFLAGICGGRWWAFGAILATHLLVISTLLARSLQNGIHQTPINMLILTLGLGLAQATVGELAARWTRHQWKQA